LVCEAVQYAHGQAVIHRDLKPSNIFVKSDRTVRLLDFGIAKQLESLDVPVDQTMTGLRLLTPAYAAPEQVRGDRVGIHTDVYSLGVILYELLTGQLPFDLSNLTPAEAATVISGHDPGRPSMAAKRVPVNAPLSSLSKTAWADLDVLCLTTMHKDPQRRYRSVEALVRDVDHYLRAEPLEALPDTLHYRMGKFVRRNRRAVTAGALVFAVVVGLVVFFTIRLTKARNTALDQAARTQRIQQFMMNLFQGGDEAAGPAADMKVITMVDRGVQQAQALSPDPKVQAELNQTLGGIYQKLGKLDRADALLRQALEQPKSLFGPDSMEVAESLVALGELRSDQAQYEEAEKLIRQGLDIDKRRLPADHPAMMSAETALGAVLASRGSYEQAIQVLDEAVRLQSAAGAAATPGLANSLSELANAHYEAGHYAVADSLYRRVLEMHRQVYGARHPLVAEDLGSLGAVQQDLGYYSEAEGFYRQALDITESYYGKENPKTAAALTALGRALLYQRKFQDAVEMLQQALAIQEHVYGPVHPSVAETVNELGNVASMRDQLDEAEARFRRVAEIYRAVNGEHHYLVAIALSNVAYVYLNKKEYPRAEQLFREVIRRFTETLSADNVNTGIARIKLGRTLLGENRYAEAQVESLAGYEILSRQASPSVSYLRAARKDLVAEYESLKQPQEAARFRAELAASEQPSNVAPKN
jgi:serine/threonine-protein kinase